MAALSGRFRACGSSTVGEVLDALGLDGPMPRLRPVSPGLRFAGPAFTAKLEVKPRGSFSPEDCNPAAYIDVPPRGAVVTMEAGGAEIATLGGVAVRTAQLRRLEAIVVDGGVSDLDEILQTRFPVFAHGALPVTSRTRVRLIGTGTAVVLDGVEVQPGDILVGDSTGVVRVPRAVAQEVLERALVIAARERRAREAIEQGLGFALEPDLGFAEAFRRARQV